MVIDRKDDVLQKEATLPGPERKNQPSVIGESFARRLFKAVVRGIALYLLASLASKCMHIAQNSRVAGWWLNLSIISLPCLQYSCNLSQLHIDFFGKSPGDGSAASDPKAFHYNAWKAGQRAVSSSAIETACLIFIT